MPSVPEELTLGHARTGEVVAGVQWLAWVDVRCLVRLVWWAREAPCWYPGRTVRVLFRACCLAVEGFAMGACGIEHFPSRSYYCSTTSICASFLFVFSGHSWVAFRGTTLRVAVQ